MEIIKTDSFELAILFRGDKNADKLALILPGRLDTKDYVSCVSHADYLASKGYFAVSFDPPGTWESPGTTELFTTTNYIKAVNELIAHFGDRPTLLMGHSRGGAVAILASSNPAVTGIIVVMANFSEPSAPNSGSIEKGFRLSLRDLPPGTSKTKDQKEFKLFNSYWLDGKNYNPAETLKSCTKPKLIIYGTNDSFTPVPVVRELYETLPEPKMIKEVDCQHDYRYYPDVIKEINNEIGMFLEKY